MDNFNIVEAVVSLVKECTSMKSENYDISLFSNEYGFQVCDMVFVLTRIQQHFGIALDRLVGHLNLYSINEIAQCVKEILDNP